MIENIQENLLKCLYEDFQSSYEELLRTAVKSTMLVGRLKILGIDIYKTVKTPST